MFARARRSFSVFLLLALALCARLPAQDEDAFSPGAPDAPAQPGRKQPGWLHRPAKSSPAGQLAYANDLLDAGRTRAARRQYLALVHQWHGSNEAADAQAAYAQLLDDAADLHDAFREYQYLIDHFPGAFPLDDIVDRQFRLANEVLGGSRRGRGWLPSFRSPDRAVALFEQIVRNAPRGRHAAPARYAIAQIHEEQREYPDASRVYGEILVRHPADPLAAEAAFRRAHCLYRMAQAAPRDEPSHREALSALAACVADHPDHEAAPAAREQFEDLKGRLSKMVYDRAVFYDNIARRPRSAVIAYTDFIRHFPNSELAATARDRIDTLKLELESHHDRD